MYQCLNALNERRENDGVIKNGLRLLTPISCSERVWVQMCGQFGLLCYFVGDESRVSGCKYFHSLCDVLRRRPVLSVQIIWVLIGIPASPLLAQKLAVLKDSFQLDSGSQQELWGSSPSLANSELSIPRLYSDAGSQTDIPAEVRPRGSTFTFSFGRDGAKSGSFTSNTRMAVNPLVCLFHIHNSRC